MKRFKVAKRFLLTAIAAAMVFSFGAVKDSEAMTIGTPIIEFSSLPTDDANELVFNSSTGILSVDSSIIKFYWPDGTTSTDGGTLSYSMHYTNTVHTPGSPYSFTTGVFDTSPLANDLVVTASDGATTLLTGEIRSASITGMDGYNSGAGSAYFTITGGTLSSMFTEPCFGNPDCGGMVNLNFNLSVPFGPSLFSADFSGEAEGKIGTVPEPGTLILLGSGLLGAGYLKRRRKQG